MAPTRSYEVPAVAVRQVGIVRDHRQHVRDAGLVVEGEAVEPVVDAILVGDRSGLPPGARQVAGLIRGDAGRQGAKRLGGRPHLLRGVAAHRVVLVAELAVADDGIRAIDDRVRRVEQVGVEPAAARHLIAGHEHPRRGARIGCNLGAARQRGADRGQHLIHRDPTVAVQIGCRADLQYFLVQADADGAHDLVDGHRPAGVAIARTAGAAGERRRTAQNQEGSEREQVRPPTSLPSSHVRAPHPALMQAAPSIDKRKPRAGNKAPGRAHLSR